MSARCPPCHLLLQTRCKPFPGVAWCFVDLAESYGILGWIINAVWVSRTTRKVVEKGKVWKREGLEKVSGSVVRHSDVCDCESAAVVVWLQGEKARWRARWRGISKERKYMSYIAKLSPLKLMGPILTSTWSMGIPFLAAWLLYGYWWLVDPPWTFMIHSRVI